MSERAYTAAEVDAALEALREPGRLEHAQAIVTHAAPGLENVLARALHEGGWFDGAQEAEVMRVAQEADPDERSRAVGALVAEQTRLGMFVGVAVGFALSQELSRAQAEGSE